MSDSKDVLKFDWMVFWKFFLTDDSVFLEFCGSISKDIFETKYQGNLLILAEEFDKKYHKRPTTEDLLAQLDFLPPHEKEDHKEYIRTLQDIANIKTEMSREALIDRVHREIDQFNFEHGILKMINKNKPDSDVSQLAYEFMDRLEQGSKGGRENLDTTFLLDITQGIDRQNRDLGKVDASKLITYPIKALNDCLLGIFPGELVVIGAETGSGKTQMGGDIVKMNALAGRKVYLFSLEGSKNETISRWKYESMAEQYFSPANPDQGVPMSYPLYMANRLTGPMFSRMEAQAEAEILKMNGHVMIYAKNEADLHIDKLLQKLGRIKEADLVVIDHLHYFQMEDDSSEPTQLSAIMRKIKILTQDRGIPVVLFSHLRRKTKDRKMPDNDDFHGSSNIAKIADTTILLQRVFNPDNEHKDDCPTIFAVGKNRNGWDPRYGWQVNFDKRVRKYSQEWALMKITPYKDPEHIPTDGWPRYILDIVGKRGQERARMAEDKWEDMQKELSRKFM